MNLDAREVLEASTKIRPNDLLLIRDITKRAEKFSLGLVPAFIEMRLIVSHARANLNLRCLLEKTDVGFENRLRAYINHYDRRDATKELVKY